jgi:DHA1 family multidrug resistance protein-like MFS transporter
MALFQGGAVGFLTGRVSARRQVATGFGMLGGGLVLLLLVRSVAAASATVALLALGLALVAPNLLTLAANRSGLHAGAGLGLHTTFSSLGQIAGPLLGGLLFGWRATLPFALAGTAALALGAWLWRRGSVPDPSPAAFPFDRPTGETTWSRP